MSAVMPYTGEQVADWESRSPEPVELDLPGWARREHNGEKAGLLPNERLVSLERGASNVRFTRYWDRPLTPGHAMATATKRTVRVAGQELQLHTTSIFEGIELAMQVLFINGDNFTARFVFENCDPDLIDELCAKIDLRS
jgi:hypothetical protein